MKNVFKKNRYFENIFLLYDEILIVLIKLQNFPSDTSAYTKCFHQNEDSYLSPEQLKKMKERSFRADVNQEKSDVYSIGMTLLACTSLQTTATWYDYDQCTINQGYINYLLEFSKSQYSELYCRILRLMLTENELQRPNPTAIYRILQPYEEEILALKPFYANKEIVKKSLEQDGYLVLSEQQLDKLFEENVIGETQTPQAHTQSLIEPILIKVPFLGEDGQIYNQPAPQQQFEYLVQQSDGQPIPQLENQFFYNNQQPDYISDPVQIPVQATVQPPVYVMNDSIAQNEANVYYSNFENRPQQVQYVNPSANGIQYIQSTVQPQIFINGANQQQSQIITQPLYSQAYQNPISSIRTAQMGSNSQAIMNPALQSQVQYVQTTSTPYHHGQSQVVSQYSYNIEEKPYQVVPNQNLLISYPQTGVKIANSHVQINPINPMVQNAMNQYNVANNLINSPQDEEEKRKKALCQTKNDEQIIKNDIQNNQIQYIGQPIQSNTNVENFEPQSQIKIQNQNQFHSQVNNNAGFQIRQNQDGVRPDSVQSSNANYIPPSTFNIQQQIFQTTNNNDYINEINQRINKALQRSQDVLRESNANYNQQKN